MLLFPVITLRKNFTKSRALDILQKEKDIHNFHTSGTRVSPKVNFRGNIVSSETEVVAFASQIYNKLEMLFPVAHSTKFTEHPGGGRADPLRAPASMPYYS